jgi:hypothetical protein
MSQRQDRCVNCSCRREAEVILIMNKRGGAKRMGLGALLTLEGFEHDLRHTDRINEILDTYRIKLTGSLECKNENRIYDFIYREQPGFISEILMIMYQIGYEDGQKEVFEQMAT